MAARGKAKHADAIRRDVPPAGLDSYQTESALSILHGRLVTVLLCSGSEIGGNSNVFRPGTK